MGSDGSVHVIPPLTNSSSGDQRALKLTRRRGIKPFAKLPCRPTNTFAKNAATSLRPSIPCPKPLRICPKEICARKKWGRGRVKKKISAGAGLLFKGSGFYITDYRSEELQTGGQKGFCRTRARRRRKKAREGRGEARSGKDRIQNGKKMIQKLKRCAGLTLERFAASTLLFSALLFPAVARAQMPLPDSTTTRSSASGQFVVISANAVPPSARPPIAITNAGFIRLEPALLAVSAERIKQTLWRRLGLAPSTPWRGRIFLALHPATSPDENVAIISTRFAGVWNYRVELPDNLSRTRLTRALTGVVLLELANRDNSGDRAPEIPAWLTEGLAHQLLAADTGNDFVARRTKL